MNIAKNKKNKSIVQIFIVLVFSSGSINAQNLVDTSDWVAGTSGATTNYSLQGSVSQNSRIPMMGPYGLEVTVWQASADGSTGMNGGFEHKGLVLDTDKTYRVSFWIQSSGPNNCTNYAAFVPYYVGGGLIQPFKDENGGDHNWPYFSDMDQPNDKWFLIVGYVRSSTAIDIGDSGVYDPSLGSISNITAPSYTATDFIFPSDVSQINMRIRTFMWSCASGEKMFVYDPRVEEVSNVTPLGELLYGPSPNPDTQAPTAPTLSSTGHTDTTVNLSWSGATDDIGVSGYKVYKGNAVEATLGNVTTYQVTGLNASTPYEFKVRTLDAAGNESGDSNIVSVTTTSGSGGGSGSTSSSIWYESGSTASYSGEVAIGTTSVPSGYKLAVDGHIRTREIRVDQDTWPDYVFEEGYDLPTLEEIQKHIQENGHLPNVPSAQEVQENGIEVGAMNKLLLEKIEELTLYVIRLNALVREQKEINNEQKKELEILKNN